MPVIVRRFVASFGNVVTTSPSWKKFTITEAAFTAAATSENIELFSLSAGDLIHAIKIKHSVAFSGGGATSATLSVGITGDLTKYASAFNVFQAVAGNTFQITDSFNSENHTSPTSIRVNLVSDVNVGTLTAGVADIWALITKVV